MKTIREQIVDIIFTLSEEQLEQFREWINENVELEADSKDVMNKVIDNTIAYNSNFLIIKKFIDECDFYSLLEHGAPKDEFDSYSRELADKISFKDSVEYIAEQIAGLLDKAFSEEIRPEKYMDIAEKIKKALFEQYLVCVKDSSEGFVKAVLNYTEKSVKRNEIVSDYLIEHPEALSADILEFISGQEDFYEDVLAQYVKVGNLKELHEKLRNVSDSYPAFVGGIIRYAATAKSRKEKVLKYMNEHPDAKASEITKFVIEQDDFHEAAKSTRRE